MHRLAPLPESLDVRQHQRPGEQFIPGLSHSDQPLTLLQELLVQHVCEGRQPLGLVFFTTGLCQCLSGRSCRPHFVEECHQLP